MRAAVLIVVDDADLRGLLEMALGARHDVRVVGSAAEAFPAMIDDPPAALVVDLDAAPGPVRPEDLVERTRRRPDPPAIVVMSSDPERLSRAAALSHASFLKPFRLALLEHALETACYELLA
jgi:DNA-binding NtrC family response regulator